MRSPTAQAAGNAAAKRATRNDLLVRILLLASWMCGDDSRLADQSDVFAVVNRELDRVALGDRREIDVFPAGGGERQSRGGEEGDEK